MDILKNKVALVTGGSSGIGMACAVRLASEGVNIVFSYKENELGAKETTRKIESLSAKVVAIRADLNGEADATSLVTKAGAAFGRLDIVVNNVGGYIAGDEWNGEYKIWEQTLAQNLLSTMAVSKAAFTEFEKNQSGVFVNIASRYALSGEAESIAYSAAKEGVLNVTRAYAKLMAPWGRANAVSPGSVRAGYWLTAPTDELEKEMAASPLHRLIEPNEIADAVLFLASDQSRSITGQNIVVDGGWSLIK